MSTKQSWSFPHAEKERLIDALTPILPMLRSKIGISQDELSRMIGVSRQTYGAIERGDRRMTWNTYLSLILFFDYNMTAHKTLYSTSEFPIEIISRFNDGQVVEKNAFSTFFGENATDIMRCFDSQAMHALETLVLIEYARCTKIDGETVVKAFTDIKFKHTQAEELERIQKALALVRAGKID